MKKRQEQKWRLQKFFTTVMVLTAGVMAAAVLGHTAEAVSVDNRLSVYQPVSGISGNLSSIGSDTLINVMSLWAEGFKKYYPGVKIQIEAKGSSTAPPALIAGTSQLGPMSRPMKSTEVDAFMKKYGYKPVNIGVALDALSVYVNKDNPIESLNLSQVDAIFSSTRAGGSKTDISQWSQVGLSGSQWDRPISMYGRNSASGTYAYFKEIALKKGDYKSSVKEQPGSSAVVEGVTNDLASIGYSGMGYLTAGVRAVPLAGYGKTRSYSATPENVYSGNYPLSRYLYVYVNRKPGMAMDPLTLEFIKYVLSKEGQEQVIKDGFVPLPKEVVDVELKKLK